MHHQLYCRVYLMFFSCFLRIFRTFGNNVSPCLNFSSTIPYHRLIVMWYARTDKEKRNWTKINARSPPPLPLKHARMITITIIPYLELKRMAEMGVPTIWNGFGSHSTCLTWILHSRKYNNLATPLAYPRPVNTSEWPKSMPHQLKRLPSDPAATTPRGFAARK